MSDALVEQWARGLVGSTLAGRYRLERLLGAGGMGAVFEGTHLAVHRRVAVKLLLPDRSAEATLIERFQREAQAAARVGGRGVVEVLDFDRDPELGAFLVMELLDGASLGDVLDRVGRLPWEQVVPLGLVLLRTLAQVHRAGIVHRDLKPDNIFLSRTEEGAQRVVLLDFGVARMVSLGAASRLTQSGSVMGTPLYMAPEQAKGEALVDHRADLYSVGAILYEALGGRPPFEAESWPALFLKVFSEPPEPLGRLVPGLPEPLVEAVTRALAKTPEERPASAEEMARQVAAVLPPEQQPPWLSGGSSSEAFQSTVALDVALDDAADVSFRPVTPSERGPVPVGEGAAAPSFTGSTTMSGGQWAIRWAAFGVFATLLTVVATVYVLRDVGPDSHRAAAPASPPSAAPEASIPSRAGDGTNRQDLVRGDGGGGTVHASAAPIDAEAERTPAPSSSPERGRGGVRRGASGPAEGGGEAAPPTADAPAQAPRSPLAGAPWPSATLPNSEGERGGGAASLTREGAALARMFARAEEARRRGRRQEAKRLYWKLVERSLEFDLPRGASRSRMVAQAALAYMRLTRVGAVPKRVPPSDQWGSLLNRYERTKQRLSQAFRFGAARGFLELNQCMVYEMARFHEEEGRWILRLPLPEPRVEGDGPASEAQRAQIRQAFARARTDRARSSFVVARVNYETASDVSYGRSPCRSRAWAALQRVRATLAELEKR